MRLAIVKFMEPSAVAAEAFCAVLLRAWGLNVPEPAIEADQLAFVSMDVGFPNLLQRLGWSVELPETVRVVLAKHGARLVAQLTDTPRALAADEAINNRDRHLGNILWDGNQAAWVDHDRALGIVAAEDDNKLVRLVVLAGGDTEKVQRSAIALALTLGQSTIDDAKRECSAFTDAPGFAAFVSDRLDGLAQRVLNRFPQPSDLLHAS